MAWLIWLTAILQESHGLWPKGIWSVVDLPLWKIWKSVGVTIPNLWKNKIHVPKHHLAPLWTSHCLGVRRQHLGRVNTLRWSWRTRHWHRKAAHCLWLPPVRPNCKLEKHDNILKPQGTPGHSKTPGKTNLSGKPPYDMSSVTYIALQRNPVGLAVPSTKLNKSASGTEWDTSPIRHTQRTSTRTNIWIFAELKVWACFSADANPRKVIKTTRVRAITTQVAKPCTASLTPFGGDSPRPPRPWQDPWQTAGNPTLNVRHVTAAPAGRCWAHGCSKPPTRNPNMISQSSCSTVAILGGALL